MLPLPNKKTASISAKRDLSEGLSVSPYSNGGSGESGLTPSAARRSRFIKTGGWVWWRLLLVLVFVGLLGVAFVNRQHIFDEWKLRNYKPPADIAQLATQDTMTPYAQRLFYLNKPQLLSSVSSFRTHCSQNKDTVVLGCYHPGENGIYLYDVKDPALQGVTQVTAAHETLHAAYERLSRKDRQYVDGLLQDYYKHGLQNQRVKSEIKLYQSTEPHDVVNEMHSTFGTEITNLPAPLETYYRRYFKDRSAVVAYEQQYEQVFSARQQVVMADDQQLTAMKAQIDSKQAQLNSQQKQLQATKQQLDNLLASGQDDTYNSQAAAYNAQVNAYNAGVAALRTLIASYNSFVANRNDVADQLNALSEDLDTRVPQATAP